MNKIKDLVFLVLSTDLSYNEAAKADFHRLARYAARRIAKELELPRGSFSIRSNKAGIAVSGEVTLHADNLYIQFGQSCVVRDRFMFRHCSGQKDYTGKRNRWMRWDALLDFDKAIHEFKLAQENRWEHPHIPQWLPA